MMRLFLTAFALTGLVALGSPTVAVAADAGTCQQCHAGLGGHLAEPIAAWQGSVHAANGIGCHDCHGGDPSEMSMEAMSVERGFVGVPEFEQVPAFCGRCHIGVKEDYDQSAHGQALASGGAQCVLCHDNHSVQQASLDLINEESCSRCHDYDRAAEIRAALLEVDTAIADLEAQIAGLYRVGIATRGMSGELFAVRNDYHRLFHNVDVEAVKAESAGFLEKIGGIDAQVETINADLAQRKLAGGVVIALLLVAGVLLLMLRHTFEPERKE